MPSALSHNFRLPDLRDSCVGQPIRHLHLTADTTVSQVHHSLSHTMASNHVPSDQVPLQGQNIYSDPSYQNLFSSVERYGTPSWDAQLNQNTGLPPNNGSNQAWHHGSFPQQSYNAFSQSYGAQNHGFQTASPYQYGQFSQQGSMATYAQPSNVDPSLGLDPNALRQQQQSPYQMPMRNATPHAHSGTVTPQALQQNAVQLQNTRPTASPFQVSSLP